MQLEYLISGTSALLLLIVILALVFHSEFRKDLIAVSGEASLFNLISVKGVVVVIICVALIGGLIFPLARNKAGGESNQLQGFLSKLPFLPSDEEGALREINGLHEKLKLSLDNQIRGLSPDAAVSDTIRKMVGERVGPWAIATEAKKITISIPGRLKNNEVRGCPEYIGKTVELRSDYRLGGEVIQDEPVIKIKVDSYISEAPNCRQTIEHDLQLNCIDAKRLFSEKVLSCSPEGNAEWKVQERKLPAYATKIMP